MYGVHRKLIYHLKKDLLTDVVAIFSRLAKNPGDQ